MLEESLSSRKAMPLILMRGEKADRLSKPSQDFFQGVK